MLWRRWPSAFNIAGRRLPDRRLCGDLGVISNVAGRRLRRGGGVLPGRRQLLLQLLDPSQRRSEVFLQLCHTVGQPGTVSTWPTLCLRDATIYLIACRLTYTSSPHRERTHPRYQTWMTRPEYRNFIGPPTPWPPSLASDRARRSDCCRNRSASVGRFRRTLRMKMYLLGQINGERRKET